ncbi:ATP-binding protein [Halobacillus litoralis]|uniref:IstB-like ATP-binding domain-containing protein n=1 Tax=Halobacillus litoralis TaxID=45668 RepID=A0A410MCL4_9BACI|nr:ATP-binding protein [Halobacillus litoralis]QAS52406.1 hypothetical protein HLI_09250 [Halobacillus litoralis]
MNGTADGMNKVMKHLQMRGINPIGERECENCGSTVPIIERITTDGDRVEQSRCMNCDNQTLKDNLPKTAATEEERKEMQLRRKNIGFSKMYEVIPESLKDATFKNYFPENDSEKEAKKAAIQFVKQFDSEEKENHSLILRGGMGVGKSHLARCISRNLREFGKSTMFIQTDDLLKLLRSSYDRNSSLEESEVYERLGSMDVLILDEVGAEYHRREDGYETWASEKILKLVDTREIKPTVFTSNYTAEELIDKYGSIQGGRIVSRMKHGAENLILEGRDRRL